jgi:hypothetical protein
LVCGLSQRKTVIANPTQQFVFLDRVVVSLLIFAASDLSPRGPPRPADQDAPPGPDRDSQLARRTGKVVRDRKDLTGRSAKTFLWEKDQPDDDY